VKCRGREYLRIIYGPEYTAPENLAIVGTVNMDESTHSFSRKVLDRAFTIELSDVNLAQWNPNGERVRTISTWPVTSWNPIKIQLSELVNPNGWCTQWVPNTMG